MEFRALGRGLLQTQLAGGVWWRSGRRREDAALVAGEQRLERSPMLVLFPNGVRSEVFFALQSSILSELRIHFPGSKRGASGGRSGGGGTVRAGETQWRWRDGPSDKELGRRSAGGGTVRRTKSWGDAVAVEGRSVGQRAGETQCRWRDGRTMRENGGTVRRTMSWDGPWTMREGPSDYVVDYLCGTVRRTMREGPWTMREGPSDYVVDYEGRSVGLCGGGGGTQSYDSVLAVEGRSVGPDW